MLKGDEGVLIAAAIAGKTLDEIAAESDVSVSTVQRRLRDPEITSAVNEGRADRQRQAVGRLNADLNEAKDRLRELVHHEDPAVALRAIDKLIANAHRFNRALDLAAQDQPRDARSGAA
jgi:AcrR family transcriptional regulator